MGDTHVAKAPVPAGRVSHVSSHTRLRAAPVAGEIAPRGLSYRRSWLTACVKAGLGTEIRNEEAGKLIRKVAHRIPHDLRRTAVRNLERAGVPRSDAMRMVGHKTESIYRRYAITDEARLKDRAQRLDILHETQGAISAKGKTGVIRESPCSVSR